MAAHDQYLKGKRLSLIHNLKMSVSGHQERKMSSLIGMKIDIRKCVQKTEEWTDREAELRNLILEDPMHGSALSVTWPPIA